MAQVAAGPAGTGHDNIRSFATGQFEDESTMEMKRVQFFQESGPIDTSIARREVIVGVAFVVMDMKQAEIGGHFGDQGIKVAGEMGVAGVKAGPDAVALERGEDPEQIGRLSEQKMRQFVFQHALDAEFTTTGSHAVEHRADIFDPQYTLLAQRYLGILRSGVDDEIVHAEEGSRLDRAKDFVQGAFPM